MSEHWTAAGSLSFKDKRLEYACFGPPPDKAPTLVLLHEGLGCAQLWRDVPAALNHATGLGVLVYSRAGYGQSDPAALPRPLDYLTREAQGVLPEVLNFIGVQRAVLIGHSDGATIAAIHASSFTDTRVKGIVLIAPHFFTEAASLVEIAKARDAFETGDLKERMSKYHRNPVNAFRGWNDSWLHPDFNPWNVGVSLNDIRVPVLAIQGRDDPYGTLAQIDAVTHQVCHAPVSTLVFSDCGHAPHLKHGPAVIAAIDTFCNSLALAQTNLSNR